MSSESVLDAMRPGPPSNIDPLTALTEEAAIRRVLAYFAVTVDTRNFANLKYVFAGDATTDYGPGVGETNGLDHLIGILEAITKPVVSQHSLGTQLITLASPTSATSVTYCTVNQFGKGEHEGKPLYAYGRYEDRLEKTADGWRIVRRELKYMGTNQGDISIFGLPQ